MAPVLSHSRAALMPWTDPVQATIPKIRDGHMAAVYYGQRRSGDFYDFVRITRDRVLLAMFDVAGGLQQAHAIMFPLQQAFRSGGELLFSSPATNEPESMLELWLRLNKAVMNAA